MNESQYRPDIDGLRALAVLIVVFFHVGFKSFSGGFVGVDVFFVISGFLITRLIKSEVAEGQFSFANFYARRARRILPALFFTLAVAFVVSLVLFTPLHMEQMAGSLLYAIFSMSNIFFWRESGYFDVDNQFKPLLHTWSLGVEEQFYLIWPIVLVYLLRRRPKLVPFAILGIGLVSIVATEKNISQSSDIFFLPQFRAFEFAIGALLVWLVNYQPQKRVILEPIVCAGLALIVYSTVVFSKSTAFPGVNALIPCLGTALLIYGGTAKYCGQLLRNRIAVGLGLISYSIYLIHWPIIIFFKYYVGNDLTMIQMALIPVASILAASLMYLLIERPIRYGIKKENCFTAPEVGFVCAMCALFLSLPAADAWANKGWDWRIPEKLRKQMTLTFKDMKDYSDELRTARRPYEFSGQKRVLIVGDSLAAELVHILILNKYDLNTEVRLAQIQGECQAIIPVSDGVYKNMKPPYDDICKQSHKDFSNSDQIRQSDAVVLASNWQTWGVEQISNTVKILRNSGVKEVYVVGRKDQGLNGQMLLKLHGSAPNIEKLSARHRSQEAININAMITALNGDFKYIDMMGLVCPSENECRVLTPDKDIIFMDVMHLTESGYLFIGRLLYETGAFRFLGAAPKT